ncbi:MAG: TPM domain-containing protein [Chitinophagaceae bacterium]|nr:MAG: TPM domain-containing protein [Chitinophagaceae bacterium]
MGLLSRFFSRKEEFFTADQKAQLVQAIQAAERRTSGEVRVFIESHCSYLDAIDRAKELFAELAMHETELRNATLVYVAVKDRQAAVFGDAGIHEKVGAAYWEQTIAGMLQEFRSEHLADGICVGITRLGEALQTYFPYDSATDKNELPDDIVFGK